MIRFGLIVLLTIISLTSYAQQANLYGAANTVLMEKEGKDIEGSPFLYEDWMLGDIISATGSEFKGVPMKYNAFTDEIYIEYQGQVLSLDRKDYPSFIIYDNETKKLRSFSREYIPVGDKRYVESLIDNSDNRLLRVFEVEYIEKTMDTYATDVTVEKYVPKETIYLKLGDTELTEVKGKRSFLKQFGTKKDKIQEFMKEENLKHDVAEDLVRIIEFAINH